MKSYISILVLLSAAVSAHAGTQAMVKGDCASKAASVIKDIAGNTLTRHGERVGKRNPKVLSVKHVSAMFDEVSGTTTHFLNVRVQPEASRLVTESGYEITLEPEKDSTGKELHCRVVGLSLLAN